MLEVKTRDVNVLKTEKLIPPAGPHRGPADNPPTPSGRSSRGRRAIQAILEGEDSRFIVITGPCSIHDENAALEYARRLNDHRPEIRRPAARRDAGLLREAANDRRMEGACVRSPPERFLSTSRRGCERAESSCWTLRRWASRRRRSSWIQSCRSTWPT